MPGATKYRFRDQVLEADRCLSLVDAIDDGTVQFGGLGRGGYPGEEFGAELSGLRSVGFWDATRDANWYLREHRNEGIEIAFLESGKLPFMLNKEWHEMRSGSLTVTRPWQPHGLGQNGIPPSKLTWFIIDVGIRMPNQEWKWPDWIILSADDLNQLTALLRRNEIPIRQTDRLVAEPFIQLRNTLSREDRVKHVSGIAILINSILLALIDQLKKVEEEHDESLSSSRRAVEIFLNELSTHPDFIQRDWTLNEMADECSLGRTVFSDLCKEICNLTPFEFLNRSRVNWAIEDMGQHPDKSLTEIGIQAGYCSSAYFSKVFKEIEGMTPSQYRKQRFS